MPLSHGLGKGLHRPQGDPAGLGGALWRKELRLPQALHRQAFIPPMAVLRTSAVTSPTFQRLRGARPLACSCAQHAHRSPCPRASLVSSLSGVWGLAPRAVPDLAVPLRSLIL